MTEQNDRMVESQCVNICMDLVLDANFPISCVIVMCSPSVCLFRSVFTQEEEKRWP